MVASPASPVKPSEGYIPGSLDRLVRQWARRYYPDADATWQQHRAYYAHEYTRQELGRKEAAA